MAYIVGENTREIVPARVDELAASIKALATDPDDVTSGLLEPIVVTYDGKHYHQEAGFHRVAALKKLGVKAVPVTCLRVLQKGDPLLRGIAENTVRSDVNLFVLSKKLCDMVLPSETVDGETGVITKGEPTYSRENAAASLGFSVKYINNLVRCQSKLAPEILSYWEKDAKKGGLLPSRMLVAWSAYPDHKDQLKAFKEWIGGEQRSKADRGEDEDGKSRKKNKGRTKKEIVAACDAQKEGTGKRIALEWVLGLRRKLDE
jgi:hypothetical protein